MSNDSGHMIIKMDFHGIRKRKRTSHIAHKKNMEIQVLLEENEALNEKNVNLTRKIKRLIEIYTKV